MSYNKIDNLIVKIWEFKPMTKKDGGYAKVIEAKGSISKNINDKWFNKDITIKYLPDLEKIKDRTIEEKIDIYVKQMNSKFTSEKSIINGSLDIDFVDKEWNDKETGEKVSRRTFDFVIWAKEIKVYEKIDENSFDDMEFKFQ